MHFHISQDVDSLSQALAEWITGDIKKALATQDTYTLVLSGGSTPKELYTLLAADPYRDGIDWGKIHVFWGDERYVPFGDERNNGKMAYDALLKKVPIPPGQIHYMDTGVPPEQSASQYEKILHRYFDSRQETFDLVLLGMGDDGHTLSLFPGTPVIHEQKAWVKAPYVEKQHMHRITLTAPVVNKASTVVFLVAGGKKADTLKQVTQGPPRPDLYPSQVIRPANGNLHWFIDEAAASLLAV
ncbi:MAG TPA: 6-phosphogluconolactonase [Chitinophagaceae bacterium]|nr:6-phosphogluconolactonase [Chitinophagaceae bacterium]